jgi:hypothetical protein
MDDHPARLLENDSPADAQPALSLPRADDAECWVCGAVVVDVHCKIVCRNCGFTRDCSDP